MKRKRPYFVPTKETIEILKKKKKGITQNKRINELIQKGFIYEKRHED